MPQEIKITNIEIILIKPNNGLIGFASFILNDSFFVGSVGIYTRLNGAGFRLTYPTRKVRENIIGIFYPINADIGKIIEQEISNKINSLLN